MSKRKWNIDLCLSEALKYERKIDFLKGNKIIYNTAYRYGWLDDFIPPKCNTIGDI